MDVAAPAANANELQTRTATQPIKLLMRPEFGACGAGVKDVLPWFGTCAVEERGTPKGGVRCPHRAGQRSLAKQPDEDVGFHLLRRRYPVVSTDDRASGRVVVVLARGGEALRDGSGELR